MSSSKSALKRPFLYVTTLALLLGVTFFSFPASAFENGRFFGVAEGEFLGGFSKIEGNKGIGTTVDRWTLSPNFKLSDVVYWLNVYNGSYNRSSQVVAQEEGGRQAQEYQSHSLSTAFKIYMTDDWSLRPIFFADWVFVNETRDESFGDGLYDYRDIGGGLESAWTLSKTDTQRTELRTGYRFFEREYPNYRSLLSLFEPNGSLETNEKDFNGHKFNLSYDVLSREDWSWGIEGILLYKDYDDKKTINSNGIRQGDTREDFLEYLNVNASHPINDSWRFRIDGQLAINNSNLDFYDTHNSLSPSDDTFVEDYFDYWLVFARPSLIYTQPIDKDRNLIMSGSYTIQTQQYPGRKAQTASGTYTSEDQEDWSHTLSGRFSYPINKNWAWVSSASYTTVSSNQDFEAFYLYTYDSWNAVTGVSISY